MVIDKAKVLFVINSPIVGGAERHTYDLAQQLNSRGFQARIFSMKDGPAYGGGEVEFLRPGPGTGLARRIFELRDEISRGGDFLVVGVNERPILAAFLARLLLGGGKPPIAGVMHSTALRNWRQYAQHFLHFPVFSAIDAIIFISENQRRFWTGKGLRPRKATTIVNGVDTHHYTPKLRDDWRASSRAELGFVADDFVIALCAVFRPEKNHSQFLDVLAQLRRDGLPARGLLIGDGAMRDAIERRIAELSLQGAVTITGLQRDVRKFVAAADIGVNCSTSIETLSLSALETLAMGVPMAMSDIGGASEIIDGRNGRLFPANDAEGMKQALKSLYDPETRQKAGLAARASVEKRFDHRAMVDSYVEYFNELNQLGPVGANSPNLAH